MSPRVHVKTHTQTRTRLAALSFHGQRFMELAGVSRKRAETIAGAIEKKWLSSVGVYGYDGDNERVVEQEFMISWDAHEQLNATNPTIDVSQPGWEDNLAVEVQAACSRFRKAVDAASLEISFWVTFIPEIRNNPELHKSRCKELGLSWGGTARPWKGKYNEVTLSVSGLDEATIKMRVYED